MTSSFSPLFFFLLSLFHPFFSIFILLTPKKHQLLEPWRFFMKEGEFKEFIPKSKSTKDIAYFLFNDLLIRGKRKTFGKISVKSFLLLSLTKVRIISETGSFEFPNISSLFLPLFFLLFHRMCKIMHAAWS